MRVQIHASRSRGGHGGSATHQWIQRGSWGSRYTPAVPEGVMGVQIHASGSRGSGESRYTTVDLEGVTRVKIHATKSTGSHEGPYTRQWI